MALKIMSFIFAISCAFGIQDLTHVKDIPFDVNEVIDRVNNHRQVNPRIPNHEFQHFDYGEFLIDTSIVYTSAPDMQRYPSIAFDGTNYLIVWEDFRDNRSRDPGGFPLGDIYGARVSPSGILIDSAGIAIATIRTIEHSPSVTFGNTNYLVVWSDFRSNPGVPSSSSSDIYGTRVSKDGIVLDTQGIVISMAEEGQRYPRIAFDGVNYFIVWEDERNYGDNYYDIYGARVSQSGSVLDPQGIAISKVYRSDQTEPSVAFDGSNYLVVWADTRNDPQGLFTDIYGARVNPAGIVLDTVGAALSTAIFTQDKPSVSFGFIDYFVTWEDERNGYDNDIYGARVNQSGEVLEPNGIPISTAQEDQWSPSISFDSTNYFIVWEDYRRGSNDIYGTRVNQNGVVLDSAGISIMNAGGYPSIAFDGINLLVVWEDWRIGYSDIYGTRVNRAGIVADSSGIAISTSAYDQYSPSVAYDGTNYLVVWSDYRNNPLYSDIYGARINQSGIILDQLSIAISTVANSQMFPSVAFGETSYFVVWQDERSTNSGIYGARVTQTGIVLDPLGIPISTGEYYQVFPTIAFDGTNYLVVWQDHRNPSSYYDIYGARINQSGIILDPEGIAIATGASYQDLPSIAFGGTNYLVVWCDHRNGIDIYGSRVSQSGSVLDPPGFIISNAPNKQRYPSVSSNDEGYFVVWEDYRDWGNRTNSDVYGSRVNQDGVVLDTQGIAISIADWWQISPSVAFNGEDYLIVWEDWSTNYYSNIIGAKLNQSGVIIDTFTISLQSGDQTTPILAHGTGEQFLITYSGFTDSINHNPANTMRIWGKLSSDIGIGEENSKVKTQKAKLLEIYPNPARGKIYVNFPLTFFLPHQWVEDRRRGIKIFDVSGKLVKEKKFTSAQEHKQEMKISLKGINPGIYFLRLGEETKKFLVVK